MELISVIQYRDAANILIDYPIIIIIEFMI